MLFLRPIAPSKVSPKIYREAHASISFHFSTRRLPLCIGNIVLYSFFSTFHFYIYISLSTLAPLSLTSACCFSCLSVNQATRSARGDTLRFSLFVKRIGLRIGTLRRTLPIEESQSRGSREPRGSPDLPRRDLRVSMRISAVALVGRRRGAGWKEKRWRTSDTREDERSEGRCREGLTGSLRPLFRVLKPRRRMAGDRRCFFFPSLDSFRSYVRLLCRYILRIRAVLMHEIHELYAVAQLGRGVEVPLSLS